jgi:3-deoxy-D-arabino-heptulosonate 7-phosphate (DAHP) synthase
MLSEFTREELAAAIEATAFSTPTCPVYQNVTAKAVSDGRQSLKPEKFAEMVKQVGQIAQIMGRKLATVQGEYVKQGWA